MTAKGSKLLIQDYVNNRENLLNTTILTSSPSLQSFIDKELSISWFSPLKDGYKEYRNEFLDLFPEWRGKRELLGNHWPRQGPQWDALAEVQGKNGQKGLLLLEAKAHVNEMTSKIKAVDVKSKALIESTLEEVKLTFGSHASMDIWLNRYYQLANRLAYLYILNEKLGIPTWLIFCNFVDDDTYKSTDLNKWLKHYQQVWDAMDIRPDSSELLSKIATIYPSGINM